MRAFGRTIFVAALLFAVLLPRAARADASRLTVDWARLLEHGYAWIGTNAESDMPANEHLGAPGGPQQLAGARAELGVPWFGVAPHVSLVARDWGAAHRLLGGPVSLTDAMRLSRSSRMVISRVRLGEGRISPFVQLGLGQWRVDTSVVLLPMNTELAAQFGGGFEVKIARGWELACETGLTMIYREEREPQNLPTTRLFGSMIASRIAF